MVEPNKQEASVLLDAQGEFIKNGNTTEKCPRCKNRLVYEKGASWEITRCENVNCIIIVSRGI